MYKLYGCALVPLFAEAISHCCEAPLKTAQGKPDVMPVQVNDNVGLLELVVCAISHGDPPQLFAPL